MTVGLVNIDAVKEPLAAPQGLHLWGPVVLGLLLLAVPTYWDLYHVFWSTPNGAYGGVMFLMILWLMWRERDVVRAPGVPNHRGIGAALFVIGLLCYVVGRSQHFHQLEMGAQIPLLMGLAFLFLDERGVRRLAFPIGMLLFVVPLPGSLADQLLLPLKELVSAVVDHALHWAGYPIARNGVVLFIGSYSLLIADACSGLNSMVALSGIGLIYLHLAGHSRRAFNIAVLLSILPIAFAANVLRVIALVLITYHGGDGAGSSFHEHAAFLEIAVAFGAFFALDMALRRGRAPA
jgi:exosortase B